MKNLSLLWRLAICFLIISSQTAAQAQTLYGQIYGSIDDTWVINNDRTDVYSALRFQTGTDKAILLSNKGTGLTFHYSNSTTDFHHEGTSLMSILNNGRVGIGTTNPEKLFHVVGGDILMTTDEGVKMAMGDWKRAGSNNAILYTTTNHDLFFGTNDEAHAVLTTGGNFGIGIDAPTVKLEVNGTTRSSLTHSSGSGPISGEGAYLGWNRNGGSGRAFLASQRGSGDGGFEFITYNADNSLRNVAMTILGTGNVGIGVATPNAPLQFHNTIQNRKVVLWETQNNDHQFYGFGVNGFTLRYQASGPNADHVFYSAIDSTSSKELMRIKGDGKVGIGTNNPLETLDVNGSFRAKRVIIGSLNFATHVRDELRDATGISYYLWVEKGIVAEDFAIAPKADWDDYVFNEDYELPTLEQTAAYIKANKHLPNIPSATEVSAKGYTQHKLNRGLLKQVEELTLHTISQEQRIKALEAEVAAQKAQLEQFSKLEQRIKQLEAKQ